ncbi:MAG: carbohydrate ABC transporter permease [Devosia sp.]|nr:carbohydrate ABC transporter permease [Devosia sp.]
MSSLTATPTGRWPAHLALLVLGLATVFPLIWMVSAAFTPNDLIADKTVRFLPEHFTFSNYTLAASREPIWAWLWNSIVTSALITVGKLVLSLPAGFAFARFQFRGRDVMFWIVIATMTFPAVLAVIPTYIVVIRLQAFDTLGAMIIPSIPYVGFYVFYFRQAFRSLPMSMFEAARMDGAGVWREFWEIAVPNVLPSVAALSVISFMGAWNIYLWAQLVLNDGAKKTLTTGIAMFAKIEGTDDMQGPLMATSLLSIVPVLLLFLLAQRFMVDAFGSPGTDR